MEQNKRERGYYWITAWGKRMIAYWDTCEWRYYSNSALDIPEKAVTYVNENRIIETT